jgi:dTDP-4-dehydrorhamnose reductase
LLVHAAYARDEASIVTATANVAHACARAGVEIVHVSSDAVFAGDGLPRPESAPPDAVWDYGRWKAQAEQDVLRLLPTSAVVRLPLIVSIDPPDQMISKILAGVSSGVRTVWYDDEIRQPASAADLAAGLWAIARLEGDRRAGLWHLPGAESLTRHQVADRAATLLGLEADAIVGAPAPSPSDRPRHIHLSDDRAKADITWAPSRVLLP